VGSIPIASHRAHMVRPGDIGDRHLSMHYIEMLAFSLPIPALCDWPTVLLSLIGAIFASAVALFIVNRKKMGWPQAVLGSVMGAGIATVHYTGMAAMRLAAMCSYDPWLLMLTLSVVR
jgi:two-component system sensor histidine kinase/response regulator